MKIENCLPVADPPLAEILKFPVQSTEFSYEKARAFARFTPNKSG